MEEALLKRLRETISKRLEWALKLQSLITSEPEKGVKLEGSGSGVSRCPIPLLLLMIPSKLLTNGTSPKLQSAHTTPFPRIAAFCSLQQIPLDHRT